jgi:hypothetical protein
MPDDFTRQVERAATQWVNNKVGHSGVHWVVPAKVHTSGLHVGNFCCPEWVPRREAKFVSGT